MSRQAKETDTLEERIRGAIDGEASSPSRRAAAFASLRPRVEDLSIRTSSNELGGISELDLWSWCEENSHDDIDWSPVRRSLAFSLNGFRASLLPPESTSFDLNNAVAVSELANKVQLSEHSSLLRVDEVNARSAALWDEGFELLRSRDVVHEEQDKVISIWDDKDRAIPPAAIQAAAAQAQATGLNAGGGDSDEDGGGGGGAGAGVGSDGAAAAAGGGGGGEPSSIQVAAAIAYIGEWKGRGGKPVQRAKWTAVRRKEILRRFDMSTEETDLSKYSFLIALESAVKEERERQTRKERLKSS